MTGDRRAPAVTRTRHRAGSGIDPWGPVLALIGLAVFLLHGYDAALRRDLGLYAYSGQRVAAGDAPYEGVLNRAGPFGHLVNGAGALLARLLHTDDIYTMRAVMTVLTVATVWVLYLVGRDLLDSRLAGIVTAVAFIRFRQLLEFATSGPREKTTMLLLVAVALWLVLHRRWGAAGVAVALGTLTWQPEFFLTAPAAAGALLALPARERVRGLVRFAAGGIATTVAFGVLFWLWGSIADFVQCFFLINLRYTSQGTGLDLIRDNPAELYDGFALDLVLLLLGLAALVVLAAVGLRRLDRGDGAAGAAIGLGIASVSSVAWALFFALQSWADVMVMTPLAALGLGALVHHARAFTSRTSRGVTDRSAAAVVAALCAVAVALAGWTSYSTRTDDLVLQRAQVSAVLAAAPPGSTVASIGAPQVLALGHRVNPNRYQMFINGFDQYLDDTYPGGLDGIRRLIESEHPTLLAFESPWKHPFMKPLLTEQYTKIGNGWHFYWYARNDLGGPALHRLRDAAAAR